VVCPYRDTPQQTSRRRTARQRAFTGRCCSIEDNLSNLRLVERIIARRPGVRWDPISFQGRPRRRVGGSPDPTADYPDLHLPDMPGADVLVRFLPTPTTKAIPVVMPQRRCDSRAEFQGPARRQGARAYLTKPLDVRELLCR